MSGGCGESRCMFGPLNRIKHPILDYHQLSRKLLSIWGVEVGVVGRFIIFIIIANITADEIR